MKNARLGKVGGQLMHSLGAEITNHKMLRPKHITLLFIIFILLQGACVGKSDTLTGPVQVSTQIETSLTILSPTPQSVKTLTPISVATFTAQPSQTSTPTLTSTTLPTLTSTPIPPKPILISYRVTGGDGGDEVNDCLLWFYEYSFVLYEDGQLIFKDGNELKESFLSKREIDDLLNEIAKTNFFQVDGTGDLRERDPIYQDPPDQVGDGGAGEYLTVKSKTIFVYLPLRDYLVEPVKQTLDVILGYHPPDSHPYKPDRLWLWIFPVVNSENVDWGVATPIPPVEEWPHTIAPLSELVNDYNYALLESEEVLSVVNLFGLYPSSRVFREGNREFYVVACPVLP